MQTQKIIHGDEKELYWLYTLDCPWLRLPRGWRGKVIKGPELGGHGSQVGNQCMQVREEEEGGRRESRYRMDYILSFMQEGFALIHFLSF